MKTRKMTIDARKAKKDQEIPFPGGFSRQVIEYLRPGGKERLFSAGEVIIHQGAAGSSFYVILAGQIEVRLVGEEHRYLPLAQMGPGDSFGEMALLRGEPASADIVALTPVNLLECQAEFFQKALADSAAFRNELMARMAKNLQDTSTEAWTFFQRAEAYNMLAHIDISHAEPLISRSTRMQQVEKEICQFAQVTAPVLISGGPGTGKLFTARKIHNLSPSPSAPFIVVDCERLDEIDASSLLFGSSRPGKLEGYLEGFGALHLAHGGTLVLRHIDTLDVKSQEFLSCYLELLDFSGNSVFPVVKVIGTTRKDPSLTAAANGIAAPLLEKLSGHQLHLPYLKDRRADILPLAQIFLDQVNSGKEKKIQFSRDAEHALLSQKYSHNNVKELREAVEMAVLFGEEGEILEEHIFVGPKDKGTPAEFDLQSVSIIHRILHGKHFLFLQAVRTFVAVSFMVIILACLFLGDRVIGQRANLITWGIWEPLLIISFLLFGHLWCTVCPISTISVWIQRLFSLRIPPLPWLKSYWIWFAVGGFFLIIWTERIFHMTDRPLASGLFLLALITGAVVCSVIFQREVWCRYICPLGVLASNYSFPAVLHIRAKPHVCTTFCTSHECYKGTEDTPGCPVFHHPLYISDGHNCKLCFKCLRICPHNSIGFYLRPPLQAIWLFGGFARVLTPFALVVFFLAPVMLASTRPGWLPNATVLTIAALGAVFLGITTSYLLSGLLTDSSDTEQTIAARSASALLVLAWGPLMAYQLSNIPGLHAAHLLVEPGSFLANMVPRSGVKLLVLLQLTVIFLAALLALITYWRIRYRAEKEEISTRRWGWNILLIIGCLYTLFSVLIVLK